jgi:regulatory protein
MPPGAFELAVGAISRKERTVAELREWLAARDVATDEAEEALERLIEIGELDDERFARLYAEDKRDLRGWGPDRIREALVERGIERRTARVRPSRPNGRRHFCADAARIFAMRPAAPRRSPTSRVAVTTTRWPTRRCAW